MDKSDITIFPIVNNINQKRIADDIIPFIPNDLENQKMWKEMLEKIWKPIIEDFKNKGIPLPKIIINHSKTPIVKNKLF